VSDDIQGIEYVAKMLGGIDQGLWLYNRVLFNEGKCFYGCPRS